MRRSGSLAPRSKVLLSAVPFATPLYEIAVDALARYRSVTTGDNMDKALEAIAQASPDELQCVVEKCFRPSSRKRPRSYGSRPTSRKFDRRLSITWPYCQSVFVSCSKRRDGGRPTCPAGSLLAGVLAQSPVDSAADTVPRQACVVVAADGTGEFRTVRAGIAAAPVAGRVLVRPGSYAEALSSIRASS